jgi:5S rRNA maturation endonuclease (ribonuclease M5)
MTLGDNSAEELAARLMISPYAVREAVRRGFVGFKKRRGVACWRFGDKRNDCLRRLDGQPFRINGKRVKAEAETHGDAWHQLIGLDDVFENDRGEILLTPEGSKDALAALHLADAEDTLRRVGVVAALGSAVKPTAEDIEKLRGRRIQIFPDVDDAGQNAAERIGQAIATLVAEVQVFDLARLYRDDGERVKDLFDVTRIDYDDFEANRGLWSLTDLDRKGERVKTIPTRICFSDFSNIIPSKSLSSPPSSPHVSPEFHGFPVYPVSNSQEFEKELMELASCNACIAPNTARKRRWKLLRDLHALQKRISRNVASDELMKTFEQWYRVSQPNLDRKKTRNDYLAAFLAELGKVRVPTGEGDELKKALGHVLTFSVFDLPVLPEMAHAPENWRRLAALHRELARQSANGTYFLSCRDAAKASPGLSHQTAYNINLALDQVGVIKIVRVGDARPGGKASMFRYLLPL